MVSPISAANVVYMEAFSNATHVIKNKYRTYSNNIKEKLQKLEEKLKKKVKERAGKLVKDNKLFQLKAKDFSSNVYMLLQNAQDSSEEVFMKCGRPSK